MPVTPEALATVRKVAAQTSAILADPVELARVLAEIDEQERREQHDHEVAEGLIPADSPPDFIRADWGKAEDHGNRPGWFGPDYNAEEALRRSEAYASAEDEHHEDEHQADD